MKPLKFKDFLTESTEHKELLKRIEGSNVFPQEITNQYTIIKEKYPDWKDSNAEQIAKNRKKELESQGYSVKLKKHDFTDLSRGYSWSITAIKDKTVSEKVVAKVVKPEDVKNVKKVKKVEEPPKEEVVEEKPPKKKGLTIKQKRHLPQALQDAILKAQGESFHVRKFGDFVNEEKNDKKKDTTIPISRFPGLKKASSSFSPFDILAFVTDPGYGYNDVKMLLLKFHKKPGKYDNQDGLGLCIYNVATHEFIEEPADLSEYNEGDLTEDKLYKRYRLKRSSYLPKENESNETTNSNQFSESTIKQVCDEAEYGNRILVNGKTVWGGLGDRTSLYSFANELTREKWEKSGEKLRKKLLSLNKYQDTIEVQSYTNTARFKGKWGTIRTFKANR